MCPTCKFQLTEDWYYCPNCGKELKEKPLTMSKLKEFGMYTASFLLSPIGLHWAIKYIKYKQARGKRIAIIIFLLTITSTSITIYTFKKAGDTYSNMLKSLNKVNNINDVGKLY